MKTKRILALVLAVLMIVTCFASCRTKDENAYTFTYGDKTVNIRTALYMCFLIDADQDFQSKAVEAADEAGTKYKEYQELKYEDKDYDTWTKDAAKQSAEKYAYAEIEFDRLGLYINEDEESYIKYYAETIWDGNESYGRYSEVYEANGISYNTFLDYYTNSYKQQLVYNFYVENEEDHDHEEETTAAEETTTSADKTAAETTTEKQLDPEIEKLRGSMRPEDKAINSALSSNFVPVYMIDVSFTDDEGNDKDDATKKSQLKLLKKYANQLNKGTDFATVYSKYQQEFDVTTDDSSTSSASNYEAVLLSAKANEVSNNGEDADENFNDALKMKVGEAKVIENEECYTLVYRRSISKDSDSNGSSYKDSYSDSAINVLVKDDYDKNVVDAMIKEMKCTENSSAVKFYSPDKIDYLQDTTAETTTVA